MRPRPPSPAVSGLYDALLLPTAGAAGCAAVISEGMAADATLAGVRVVPAFTAAGAIAQAAQAVLGVPPGGG